MNKELRKLTWKYFWQQKITEVTLALLILSSIIFLPYLLGHNIGNNNLCMATNGYSNTTSSNVNIENPFNDMTIDECKSLGGYLKPIGVKSQWGEGLLYIIMATFSLVVIGIMFYLAAQIIYEWLESNWEKAEKRAKKKVRKQKYALVGVGEQ